MVLSLTSDHVSCHKFGDSPDERFIIRISTSEDSDMNIISIMILEGRYKSKIDVPLSAKSYYDMFDTLSYEHGILLKEKAIITVLQSKMKTRLHSAHL